MFTMIIKIIIMENADIVMGNYCSFIMIHEKVSYIGVTNVGVVFGSVGRLINNLQDVGDWNIPYIL